MDKAGADVWVGYPGVRSVDLGQAIPSHYRNRVAAQPEVREVEDVVMGFAQWVVPANANRKSTRIEVCIIIGKRLAGHSIAAAEPLRRDSGLMGKLAEPYTVLIDRSERGRLGVSEGDKAVIMGRVVRVVGFVEGLRSLGGAYVFCSKETARLLLYYNESQTTYIVARCDSPATAQAVVDRLQQYPNMVALTRDEFSFRSRMHWMMTTKAGLALAFTAILGLLVGAVVTSQTLYAATAAAQREYATLRAMGIPRWRLKMSVLAQSFWVGLGGLLVAAPITLALAQAASMLNIHVRLTPIIVIPAGLITMAMALGSGLLALRSLQRTDPVHNIR